MWSLFCSKKYPHTISDEQFVKIILHQAKKTYRWYDSFYKKLDKNHCVEFTQLKSMDASVVGTLVAVTEIAEFFELLLHRIGLEISYKELIAEFTQLNTVLWKEWIEPKTYLLQTA